MWDIPRFEDIPLGSTKVPSSGLLGLVTSGLFKPPKGDFFCFSRVSSPLLLNVPQADPFFSICLLVEWREVMKRLLPVRLGIRGGPSWKRPL